jgi:predicted Rossmann fold nucleotide-binding protein DprA/Smf involved in DNA uptake
LRGGVGSGTIIVLPQGINDFSLRSELKPYVNPDNTLIISKFAPAASWNVGYAMQRNATIIALSSVMVLVEARDSGGTYNAGKKALTLDCPLFVIRFQDKLKSNIGNDYFLQHGAFELLKSRETNRANIQDLKQKVEQVFGRKTQVEPEQMTLQLN